MSTVPLTPVCFIINCKQETTRPPCARCGRRICDRHLTKHTCNLARFMFQEAEAANPTRNTTGWVKNSEGGQFGPDDGRVYWNDMPHINRNPVDFDSIWELSDTNGVKKLTSAELKKILEKIPALPKMRLVVDRDTNSKTKYFFMWQCVVDGKWVAYQRPKAAEGLKVCTLRPPSDFSRAELMLLHADGHCLGWNRGHLHVQNHYVVKEPSGSYSFTSGNPVQGPSFDIWTRDMIASLLSKSADDPKLRSSVRHFKERWDAQGVDALLPVSGLVTNGDGVHLTVDLGDDQSMYRFYVTNPGETSSKSDKCRVGGWILTEIRCPCIDAQGKRLGDFGPPVAPRANVVRNNAAVGADEVTDDDEVDADQPNMNDNFE